MECIVCFQELLQEVEQDTEHECVLGSVPSRQRRRGAGVGGGRPGGYSARAPLLAHSGSLQDLAAEAGPARALPARHAGRRSRVSARTLQGGSLPANVDQVHTLASCRLRFTP